MERLGYMIRQEVEAESWCPIKISKNGPGLSHLFFADDVLFFAKAQTGQARVIINILEEFCAISGMKVSKEKSHIYTSKGVDHHTKHVLSQVLEMRTTERITKYLGFRMFQGRPGKEDFNMVMDRIGTRLAAWKGRILNKPGRVTLANSVLSALPTYNMQIYRFPTHICDNIDRAVRSFIWKGSNEKGMHMVSWDKITKQKKNGGLAVRRCREHNTALVGKLVWNLFNNPGKLWVQLLGDMYLKQGNLLVDNLCKGSPTWNAIITTFVELQDCFQFKIGDGNSSFWYKPWFGHSRLCDVVDFVQIQDTALCIKDVWDPERNCWNFNVLYTNLPESCKQALSQVKPSVVNSIEDVWVWNQQISGTYSVASAYNWLVSRTPSNSVLVSWNWIWKTKLPASIQFFLWQMGHNSLHVRGVLHRRNVPCDPSCPLCGAAEESIIHCLFYCDIAKIVWPRLTSESCPVTSDEVMPWAQRMHQQVGIVIPIMLWTLWCARNRLLFDNKKANVAEIEVECATTLHQVQKAFTLLDGNASLSVPRQISWSRPPRGAVMLNVDGSVFSNSGQSGYGGLIRDPDGVFLHDYYGKLDLEEIIYAELVAVQRGLILCWEKGFRWVTCVSDSLTAVTCINRGVSPHHRYSNVIAEIRRFLFRDWRLSIAHQCREGNQCADYLAKLGAAAGASRVLLDSPPAGLLLHLSADAVGVSFCRR